MHVLSALEEWAVAGLAPADRRQGLAAIRFSIGVSPWGGLFAVAFGLLGLTTLSLSLAAACVGVAATAPVLRATRSKVIAAHWLAGFLGQSLFVSAWWTDGADSAALPWFAVCVVVTLIVGGFRPAMAWLAVACAALIGLAVLDVSGRVPPPLVTPEQRAVLAAAAHVGLCVVGAALAFGAVSVHERTRSELEAARLAAESANRAKSEFLSRMSHELRTPLNAIIGYAELLAEDGDEPMVRDLGHIRASGAHLLHMVNDVLDLAKIESGHLEIELHPDELGPLLEGVRDEVAPLVAQRRNRLEIDVLGSPVAWADGIRVRQCVLNLIGNAAKFTTEGEIRVLVRESAAEVVVEVHDTGIGMTAPQLARVFDPFVQAEASIGRTHGGTGLGLAIVRHIAERLGGSVTARSIPGAGSEFLLTLQRYRDQRPITPLHRALAAARRGADTPR